jgi:alpha-ketoglutarate-dependent taurine dioxygenase
LAYPWAMLALKIEPLTPTLGAIVTGVNLASDLDSATVVDLRTALLAHKLLFFRGQRLDPPAMTRVAANFGEPTPAHPVEPSVEGHPKVLSLDSEEGARADIWHSDLTFQERPPLGALLHAVEVPEVGGDTIWADTAAAYLQLSKVLRRFLEGLTATHSTAKAGGYFAQRDASGDRAARTASAEPIHHPIVRVHPETGAASLFVNPLFTDKIDGLRRRESDAVLSLIYEAATAPEQLCRWRWEAGDVAFWDNRSTMHYTLRDFGAARRRMIRVALEGDVPIAAGGCEVAGF